MNNTHTSRIRLTMACVLFIISPLSAYLTTKLFLPIICHDVMPPPSGDGIYDQHFWFSCSWETIYLASAGLLMPLALATLLLLQHRRSVKK